VKKRAQLLEIGAARDATYVYDRESIESAIAALRGLKAVDAVFYAMKANPNREILKLVHDGGLNLECVSPGELARVLEVLPGLDRKRILYTPNFAPRAEYEHAFEHDVWVTLDNLFPLRQWAKTFKGKEIFVRIDTGQGRGHHEHVRTAGVHSKFGIPLFEIDELVEAAKKAGARIVGLHAHTGSGVLAASAWLDTGRQLLKLLDTLPEVRYIDVGGGLGVPEKIGQPGLDMSALDAVLTEIKEGCGDRALFLEPGRFVVAQAGVLIARVTQTKGKGEVQYVGVGTGMNSLIRPALYGAYHDIVNLTRLGKPATELVTVVGPICETGDRLGSDRLLPATKENDVLLIANAGAYGYAMSSRYNLREPATEVLI
jgi:bifunctional diaminopimelate decarboxylase / aspartate kinase